MFKSKKERKDRVFSMQELYKSLTNANWAALSLEQNGHYKHALQSWKDLNIFADKTIQLLNEELINVNLSMDERILLDELNKLRAEIEESYQHLNKHIEKKYYQQQLQEQQQQQQQQHQLQSSQQQHAHKAQNVPTLRTNVPFTMSSRKPGSKMMKSLRPGGMTTYSVSNTSSNHTTTPNTPTSITPPLLVNTTSAKHAANFIWAPSNSINVTSNSNNNSNTSLPEADDQLMITSTNSPIYDFTDFSSTSTTVLNNNNNNNNIDCNNNNNNNNNNIDTGNKKLPSERAKAALKASAAVKYPIRPTNRLEPRKSSSKVKNTNHCSGYSKSRSQIDSTSPSRSTSPIGVSASKVNENMNNGLELDENRKSNDNKNDNDNENKDNEEDEDEKILKKVKGVDLKFARNILLESNRDQDKVYWSDIAGLEQAKETLMETVVYPFLRPDLFRGLREPVSGMLLFGPPGTGKTMLARAAATESNSTFFSIQSSSLTSKWYGESEKLVRALFQVAKAKAPSIIFVDEIDSLLGKRSGDGDDDTSRRLKNEFLVQWSDLSKAAAGRIDDNDEPPPRVLVLAATNMPWAIDEAARRRFVRRQYIPLPEPETRRAHFKKLLNNTKNSLTDDDMDKLVNLTEGYSGSDITSLAKDAAIWPIRELGSKMLDLKEVEIRGMCLADFERSMKNIRPSVNSEGLAKFEEWAREFGSSGA
jgi:SpoVK/Ycf46/Vps4 family AAA+-type ATPase